MRKLAGLIAGLALLAAPAMLGQVQTHAQTGAKSGPNGGMVAGAGQHQAELVVTGAELSVYWLEDGKPHPATGTTLRAVIQQAGKTTTLDLADNDGSRLSAKLPAPLQKGAIVVLSGKDDHGGRFTARYVIK